MESLKGRDLLSMADLTGAEVSGIVKMAIELKTGQLDPRTRQILGLLFTKASTRTRVSFTAAMYQLGGQVIDLNPNSTQIGRGEPLKDTARVIDRYLDILAVRTFAQQDLEIFAKNAEMPIINALTDLEHPCQVLADLQTIQEQFGTLQGLKLAYCGDGNNMAHSLLIGGALVGIDVAVAAPAGFAPDPEVVAQAQKIAQGTKAQITITEDPSAAVRGANIVYTDVWASMGQEAEATDRIPLFMPYQVNKQLMSLAAAKSIVLHCLPAHREEEITAEVLEGDRSRVWEQAENRLHAQKALIVALLGIGSRE
jgi:ornithine carbamoyltransferase